MTNNDNRIQHHARGEFDKPKAAPRSNRGLAKMVLRTLANGSMNDEDEPKAKRMQRVQS